MSDAYGPDDEREATAGTVRTWPVAGGALALCWVFVRGVALEPTAIVGQLLAGLAVGLPIAFLFRRLYVDRVDLARLRALPYAVLYLATFAAELVRANLDVAYRVLAPGMPMEPEVLLLPLRVESAAAVTHIANSITITPGTVTLDYDEEANALYVHVIDGRDLESVVATIRRWEDYALELFDEGRSAADPPREIVVSGGDHEDYLFGGDRGD